MCKLTFNTPIARIQDLNQELRELMQAYDRHELERARQEQRVEKIKPSTTGRPRADWFDALMNAKKR